MKLMKSLVRVAALGMMAVAVVSAAGDEKFGKGVSLTEATSIKAIYENPDKFVGKTIRIDGVVTGVCEEMGCWMALGEKADSENTVRLKVDHDANIAFPISAKGKKASAEGVFEKIDAKDKEATEAATEHAHAAQAKATHGAHPQANPAEHAKTHSAADFGKKYQLKATGAIVK